MFQNGRKRGLRMNNPIPSKLRPVDHSNEVVDEENKGEEKPQTKLAYLQEMYGGNTTIDPQQNEDDE